MAEPETRFQASEQDAELPRTKADTRDHDLTGLTTAETADASTIPLSSSPSPRGRTGRFTIVRQHAQGGLGKVSVAHDADVNRLVAFKEIRPDRDSTAARQRFLNEAEITGQLEHPGIVPIYAAGTDDAGHPFYAMRFIEGKTLADEIREFHASGVQSRGSSSLQLRNLLQRFVTVCQTLAFVHNKGVIHRDLKPANVLLGDYGETLVVDWGLAKKVLSPESSMHSEPAPLDAIPGVRDSVLKTDSGLTQAGQVLGTPAYMSPEQATGQTQQLGAATDIFALGVMLYEMLTGQLPFGATYQEVVAAHAGDPPRPSQHCPGVPRALEAILLKALSRSPQDRYASAADLAKDVERWLADEPVTAWTEPFGIRLRRWVRRHRTLVTSASLAFVLLAGGAAISIYQWQSAAHEQEQLRHQHVSSLRQTAEAQEQIGLSALRSNRWIAAAQLFEKALEPLGDDPEIAELRQRLHARLARTQRLVRYQQFEQEMGESVVLDQEAETLKALEQALDQFEVFAHPRWWEALPDEDLTPRQRELLRLDVHGHLLMLGAVHARHGFMNLTNPAKAREGGRRGLEVLTAAKAFASTLTGDYLEYYCRLSLGLLSPGTKFEGSRTPTLVADELFLGMLHQWLSDFGDDPLTRFMIQSINSPLLDLKTPLATSERYLRTAIAQHPDYPTAYALMTDTLYRANKYGEAEFSARAHVALSPDQPLAYRMLAMSLLAQASGVSDSERRQTLVKQALQEADKMAEVGGFRWQDHLFRAALRLEAEVYPETLADLQKAEELLMQLSPTHPRLAEVHNQIGVALSNLERNEEAVVQYTEALRLHALNPVSYKTSDAWHMYLNRGEAYLELKNYVAALTDLNAAIKIQGSADAYNTRARIHLRTGKLDLALEDANRAIRMAPKGSTGYLRRAEVYLRKGDLPRTLADCDQYQALKGKGTLVHEFRGRVHGLRGDWAAAATEFRTLVQKDPANSNGRFWLGTVLLGQGDLTGYRQVCTECLDTFEPTADAAVAGDIVLLCSYGPEGGADPARVLAFAERKLKGAKDSRELLALGGAYLRADRCPEALECFDRAHPTMRPAKPWVTACLFRGLCEHRLGRRDEARRWFDPCRQWYDQFLTSVRASDFTKTARFDSLSDWQSRILMESMLREVGESPASAKAPLTPP
jgi:serine/threonine protein kinase/Flp pilus assembly protein TadD